jgi:hypothetical protein
VAAAAAGLLLEFLLFFRELGLQSADVGLGGLIVGRLADFLADLLDFLLQSHRATLAGRAR